MSGRGHPVVVSLSQLGLALLVVAVGATVQRTVGFGAGLVSVPLLLLIDPDLVPGPVVTANLALILLMSIGTGHHADRHGVRWMVAGLLPGTLVGGIALVVASEEALVVLAAGIVLAAVVAFVTFGGVPVRWRSLLAAGSLSGFMGATAGIGGPPLALLYSTHPGDTVRATLSRVFLCNWGLIMATLIVTGTLGRAEALTGLALMPGGVLGVLIGRRTARVVDAGQLRTAVLVVATASALAAIARVVL